MKNLKLAALTFLACAVAGFAVAQNADQNSAGPTKNDYRLRVMEPAPGAVITGSELQIAVNTEIPGERDMRRDSNSMPRPNVDVFVDELFRETIRGGSGVNVVRVAHLRPGEHTIVLLAKNQSGEIIDRKELSVSLVAPVVAKAAPPPPAPAPAPAYEPPAPAEPPPAPVAEKLPKSGSAMPLLAVAGAGLLLAGLAIRRFA